MIRWDIETIAENKCAARAAVQADKSMPAFVVAYLLAGIGALPDQGGQILIHASGLIGVDLKTTTEIKFMPTVTASEAV